MRDVDAIVVGGGPGGASCALALREAGVDCLVLDREPFPRPKLCAGWITPGVLDDLDIEAGDYPYGLLTFDVIRVHLYGLKLALRSPQHSIRRVEFDDWLLRRSGAEVVTHRVERIERQGDRYVIDSLYRCRYLVGAGGTRCPVYRTLFRDANPRARACQAAALEAEFPCDWADGDCHLWFFADGLPGYAWYVPKRDGHLNIGVGAMTPLLRRGGRPLADYWSRFVERLDREGLAEAGAIRPEGYSYYLRAGVETTRVDNAFLVGDALGMATRDLCEGIGPAVRSGLLAARAIAEGDDYRLDFVNRFSLGRGVVSRMLEYAYLRRAA